MITWEPNTIAVQETVARETLARSFGLCVRKTHGDITHLADEPQYGVSVEDGDCSFLEDFYEIGSWTSSFFTGMALLAWRKTEGEYFLNQVLRLAPHYRDKVFTHYMDTHHDLGFLMCAPAP
jgi:unsaturated chondroitin disaccharide hydrolase